MSISYDSYKIFYYVAHYQNITLAAKALYLTQPTVSHYILNLEKDLNCKLFIRSKKGMQLSPEGELLFQHISKAYREISEGEEKLKEYISMGKGIIKIGASETSLRNYLIPVLGKFKAKYPNIQFSIKNITYQDTHELLRNGTLDLAIMTTPFPHTSLLQHHLADFSMVAIAGTSFAHLANRSLEFSEITNYPLISLEPQTSGRYYLDTIFASHGVHLQPDIELSSADLIAPMAAQNMGIGFVPRLFSQYYLKTGSVVELTFEDPFPDRSICMLSDPHRPHSVACQKFMEMIGIKE
ncbi:MAG: LysR family transcriptional regulator [Ruminococcus sp.]|nr:LysR family transcriptional regulator [Ruminococcus sp.]